MSVSLQAQFSWWPFPVSRSITTFNFDQNFTAVSSTGLTPFAFFFFAASVFLPLRIMNGFDAEVMALLGFWSFATTPAHACFAGRGLFLRLLFTLRFTLSTIQCW